MNIYEAAEMADKIVADMIQGAHLPDVTGRERWIPLSERLPATHGHYLVVDTDKYPSIELAFFDDANATWQILTYADDYVHITPSHWMSLPPLP